MNIDISKEVKALSEKAEKTEKADEALKFSQAALNLAHAQATFSNIK